MRIEHDRTSAAFHAWLARCCAPGEPLWFAARGTRVFTLTVAKAWGALGKAAREVADRGVLRTLAEVAVVSTLDGIVDDPNASAADVVWREGSGWSAPSVEVILLGLTPGRLLLLSIAESTHATTFERAYAPKHFVALLPAQVAAADLRMRATKIVRSESIELALGRGADEETFQFGSSRDHPDYVAAKAIADRIAAIPR